ncbi:hypothetical protein [Diaminobutyricibacter sp. McL0608]|uniref:hypothetical protein n=1 Tax=Leifsonia sp. McL0608 TaxID=3143537 RepID=UPI0031F2D5E7
MTSVDRSRLVARHGVRLGRLEPESPLTVGNGDFCFTVDPTGLQTFPDAYPVESRYGEPAGTLLGTMSQWGWHSSPGRVELESTMREYASPHGPALYADLGGSLSADAASGQSRQEEWLRNNPHRLDLGRIGLWLGGTTPTVSSLTEIDQQLDLARGLITSAFRLQDRPFRVQTAAHPARDAIGIRIEGSGVRGLRFAFPYGSEAWGNAADWTRPDAHRSEVQRTSDGWLIERRLDEAAYTLSITAPGAELAGVAPHEYVLEAPNDTGAWDVVVEFLPAVPVAATVTSPLTTNSVFSASDRHWTRFWEDGGAIELADSDDPRAGELERRIVLSQYATALTAGSLPPAETGLMVNSWRGKFHLEMHLWHHGWLAPWGRPQLLERSLPWYETILDRARETARGQGLPGARWPKQVGPEGIEAPSPIGPFLIWQQPHPIHLAELLYRARPNRETLDRWAAIVFDTAEFMAAYAAVDAAGQSPRFSLGPPLVPAQESYADTRATASDPTFELVYWSWALDVAARWRTRLGLTVPDRWRDVASKLAPLPVRDGCYAALSTPPYLVRDDHPSMLAALGVVPRTPLVDPATMRRTLDDVLRDWDWDSAWGWDFPMAAMTATRLGEPALAVDCLLMERPKNTYLANGHNRQNASLPIYLPGNGGLLLATGLMAAGFDGSSPTPGFGTGWRVRHDGISPLP